MKHEWKKHEKELYDIKKMPTMIAVPKQNYIMISGKGNPNHADFSERVGVLMSLAYPIKMRHKAAFNHNPDYAALCAYGDYTVFPLEGVWTSDGSPLEKDKFSYTIMVRQPDFITVDMFKDALAVVEKKKPHPFLQELKFDSIDDGLCVQLLHAGPFDDEPASFIKMDAFIKENGLVRADAAHREIYLTDARKTNPEKFKTILRYRVK